MSSTNEFRVNEDNACCNDDSSLVKVISEELELELAVVERQLGVDMIQDGVIIPKVRAIELDDSLNLSRASVRGGSTVVLGLNTDEFGQTGPLGPTGYTGSTGSTGAIGPRGRQGPWLPK